MLPVILGARPVLCSARITARQAERGQMTKDSDSRKNRVMTEWSGFIFNNRPCIIYS